MQSNVHSSPDDQRSYLDPTEPGTPNQRPRNLSPNQIALLKNVNPQYFFFFHQRIKHIFE